MKKILFFTSILFLTITTSLFAQHPTVLVASNVTSTSVDLSWDASSCGTSVNLRYRVVGGTWNPNINGVTSPYLLTGLLANTDYEWTVKCVGNSGWQTSDFFSTPLVGPTISNISIGPPILCYGGLTDIQININQTASPTVYSCIVGYYNGPLGYFVSFVSTNTTTSNSFSLDLLAGDYCIRLVDSTAYYNGNGGTSSGISTVGIYDEWCPITISEPYQLVASTSVVDVSCYGMSDGIVTVNIVGGSPSYTLNAFGNSLNLVGSTFVTPLGIPAGTYPFSVIDANNCPFNDVVIVGEPILISSIDNITTCGSYTWIDGNVYTTNNNTATYIFGCDSVVNLDIYFTSNITNTVADTACGEYLFGINLIDTSGTYIETFTAIAGCDSIVTLLLTIFEDSSVTYITACDNVEWNGNWYYSSDTITTTGLFTSNFVNSGNAWSLYYESDFSVGIGLNWNTTSSYSINGITALGQFSNQTVSLSLNNLLSHDSILVEFDLYIINSWDGNPTANGPDFFTLRTDGVDMMHTTFSNQGQDQSYPDDYLVNNPTQTGMFYLCGTCSPLFSMYKISKTISHINANAVIDFIGGPGLQGLGDESWGIDNIRVSALNNITACDSVATAIITIKNSTSSTDTQVQCDSFTWALNGQTYYTSQIDTVHSINADSCQHIDSLDLTINYSTSNLNTPTVCDSYFWPVDGNSYTTSGLYISSSTNIDGCLHTDSLDLTVNYSSSTYTAVIICDIYTWSVTSQPYTSSGLYVATSTNAAGCLHTDSLDLSILNSTTSIDNVGSHCDSYVWSLNGQTYYASQIDTVHSINADGCQHIDSLDLTIYPLINVTANIVDELCVNYADGSIILNVSGGFGSFSYSWTGPNSFNSTTRDIFNLFPGIYDLTITDITSLCTKDTSFVVGAGFDMQLTTSYNNISCYGFADGTIDINPINLISPVYNWSDIVSSIEDRINLSPGVYYLQIDDNNCFVRDTFNITQPDSLFLTATQTNITCANNTLGYVSVQVSGGIPSYSYYWSNWINIPMNDGLPPGIYDLDVIDSNGCLLEKTFEIFPYTVDVSSILENVACYGDSTASIDLTVSGGFQTYSYLWSDNSINQDIYNLPDGNISCTVTDYLGCESIVNFIITQEDEIFSTPVVSGVSCFDGNNGNVVLNIIGGVSAYNIDWYNADENNLSEGSYPYEITDINGCILHDTVYVPQEDSLVLDIIVIDLQCNGDPTGKIDVYVTSGGVGPFNYSWSGPNSFISNQYIINNLFAGLYNLTVTDSNNCNLLYQISVTEPVPVSQDIVFLISNYSGYGISCKNGSDGWISATPTGGYIPYSFDWTGPGGYNLANQIITDLSEGDYSVVVTDGLGCKEYFAFIMDDPEDALNGVVSSLYDYNGYDISCFGFNDGGILVESNGGVSPYTYIWDNVQTLNPLPFQESGIHLLTMYDNNGCPWESFIVLNQPDDLIWNTNMFPDTCEREVGEIIIDANGGVLDYIYLWSNSQNTAVATQLFEGEYSVEVVDKNGCQIFDTVSVSNLISPNMDFAIMSDYERLYKQLKDPIIFIDMTELTWQNALYWDWDFGDGTYGTDSIAFHSYQDIGEYYVLLKVTTDYNCIDTLRKKVVIEEYELFIPNAFTPNSIDDNFNDEFRPYGIGIDEFRMSIYSRWDGLIYTTYDIEVGWNGKFDNTGNEVQLGVYVYYIETKDVFGAIHKYEGQVTLIR